MATFKLLTDGNPKAAKGIARGFLTFVLHLAPARLSGFQVCASASAACEAACLNTSGRGQMSTVQAARVAKTRRFFTDRTAFVSDLMRDVEKGIRRAERVGLIPCFRFNATSDVRWETIDSGNGESIMARFPEVQFYDYTKHGNRVGLPSNYHLTFSLSESNSATAARMMAAGLNVAVVFRTDAYPKRFTFPDGASYPVHNGDATDLRFLDPPRHVVGLYAKGKAVQDRSGFVQDTGRFTLPVIGRPASCARSAS